MIAKNYPIKALILKSNGLQDGAAGELLAAVKQNKHIVKCVLDLNPAASLLINEIEQVCHANSVKVSTDFIADCKNSIQ